MYPGAKCPSELVEMYVDLFSKWILNLVPRVPLAEMMSKCGKNKEVPYELMFLPRFDVLCALSEYRPTAK